MGKELKRIVNRGGPKDHYTAQENAGANSQFGENFKGMVY